MVRRWQSDGLNANPKLFVGNTSLIFFIHKTNLTANDLNSDLMKKSNWAVKWKIRIKPDPKKKLKR